MAKIKKPTYIIAARIGCDEWEKLNEHCNRKGIKVSDWVRECIDQLP